MIRGHKVRITVDQRGKIKSGMKRPGTNLPMSLDYFNISAFKELVAAYGEEPDRLCLFFPSNTIEDFYEDEYSHYAGGQNNPVKTRSCDTETCIHRINEVCNTVKYGAGEESDCVCNDMPEMVDNGKGGEKMNPDRCRYVCYLKAYIGLPPTFKIDNPSCYLFETHSRNSGEHIKSEIEKILMLNMGNIIGVPFMISVKMIGGKQDAKQKFPIWNLIAPLLLSELRADRSLKDGFAPGTLLLDAAGDATSEMSIPSIMELLAELEEIRSQPTEDGLNKWILERRDVIEKLSQEDKKKIRKVYEEINTVLMPPDPGLGL